MGTTPQSAKERIKVLLDVDRGLVPPHGKLFYGAVRDWARQIESAWGSNPKTAFLRVRDALMRMLRRP
jgi:hypothetical protein